MFPGLTSCGCGDRRRIAPEISLVGHLGAPEGGTAGQGNERALPGACLERGAQVTGVQAASRMPEPLNQQEMSARSQESQPAVQDRLVCVEHPEDMAGQYDIEGFVG